MSLTQYFNQPMLQQLAVSCITDIVAPTFAGITGLTPKSYGALKVDYSAATDPTGPITYEIYVLPGAVSAATLFAATPCVSVRGLTAYAFLDSSGNFITKDQLYTVGVRARDAANNLNTNTATMSTTALGTANLADVFQSLVTSFAATEALLAADEAAIAATEALLAADEAELDAKIASIKSDSAECKAVFSITNANMFQGELWFSYDGSVVTTLLGAGSYTVYDDTDAPVPTFTQSGITANGNGVYVITPIDASALDPFRHYRVKIQIVQDSVTYTSYKGFTIGE